MAGSPMIQEAAFGIAPKGFATSFPAQDLPASYALQFRNLFTNTTGNAEKRQGLSQLGNSIPNHITVTNLHELVLQGESLLFASGAGQVWLFDGSADWTLVFTFGDTTAKIFSFSMASKLIFYNGVDRNVATENGTVFQELLSLLEVGVATSVSAAATTDETHLADSAVVDWSATQVAENSSIIYYTDVTAFAMVTFVSGDRLTHTPVSAAAGGVGAAVAQISGANYAILDMLDMLIVPVSGLGFEFSNTGVLVTGSTSSSLQVRGISDFTDTEALAGDFVFNQTKNQLSRITAITTAAVAVNAFTTAAAGDVVSFHKSSQPICKAGTAHVQRAFMIDARDDQKLRISGIANPQDFGGTSSGTYDISSLQPRGERFKWVLSFQRFLVLAGTRHVIVFQGTDPIGDPTTTPAINPDWSELGYFPVGVLSRSGIVNVGNEIAWATFNGIRSSTLSKTTSQLVDNPLSTQIDKTLRDLLKALPEDEIIATHYQRRNWVMFKAGDELYVYNYTYATQMAIESGGQQADIQGAWHLFDGPFAQQKSFFVRENGDLITGGTNGLIGIYDQGSYADLDRPIRTVYESTWHSFERKMQKSVHRKHGKYIKPIYEAPGGTTLNIRVDAPYYLESSDVSDVSPFASVDVVGTAVVGTAKVGGNSITFEKYPLRWHGEVAKFKFTSEHSSGPFVLSNYTVFYSQFGTK